MEIKKKDLLFESLYFVTGAVSDNESRPMLQSVHVLNNKATCIDGFRMHRAKVEGLKDGLYSVIKRTKAKIILSECDGLNMDGFPNVSSVIYPTNKENYEVKLIFHHRLGDCIWDTYLSSLLVGLSSDSQTLNYEYLKDSLIYADETRFYHIMNNGLIHLFWIQSRIGETFIMPIVSTGFYERDGRYRKGGNK